MTQVRIDSITGVNYPIDIYVADVYGNNRTYLATVINGPVPPELSYTTLPPLFDNAPSVMVIVIDANNCEKFEIVPCSVATPTPTPTPTVTSTSVTPTPTPTVTSSSVTPTPTPTNTQTPTVTSTSATPTPTLTPTNTQTPTLTPTPSETQSQFFAYVFPEALDSASQNNLGQYMFDSGASWFGFGNTGVPGTFDYSNSLNSYAHFSGFSGSVGNFITPVSTLKSSIKQSSGSGIDSFGCAQTQYTFGTIQVTTSQVNPNVYYFYTVWIPLNGVGGTMNNMTLDIGLGSSCSTNIINDGIPDSTLSQINVTVTSGAAIPAGTYRVLWMYPQMQIPTSSPLNQSIFIKGDTKT